MLRHAWRLKFLALGALSFGLSLSLNITLIFAQEAGSGEGIRLSAEQLQPALQVQHDHEAQLLSLPGVVGVGVGLTEGTDQLAIHIYRNADALGASAAALPAQLNGLPVRILETDPIVARDGPPGTNHRQGFDPPVPMGVSTGTDNGCFAGTLGYRVFRIGQPSKVGYLTNAHVAAAGGAGLCPGKAAFGEDQFQAGLLDSDCSPVLPKIGDLVQYVPLVFGGSFENTVDAAFVASSRSLVNKLILDIGHPSPSVAAPALNQTVRKSGRTTGLTKGTITTINATINVIYGSRCGTAKFVGQIGITPGSFSAAGDSGAPILTSMKDSSGRYRPVGLLFAGSSTTTFANRLSDVLGALGAVIDTQ
jgi:hypothetical protein